MVAALKLGSAATVVVVDDFDAWAVAALSSSHPVSAAMPSMISRCSGRVPALHPGDTSSVPSSHGLDALKLALVRHEYLAPWSAPRTDIVDLPAFKEIGAQ